MGVLKISSSCSTNTPKLKRRLHNPSFLIQLHRPVHCCSVGDEVGFPNYKLLSYHIVFPLITGLTPGPTPGPIPTGDGGIVPEAKGRLGMGAG